MSVKSHSIGVPIILCIYLLSACQADQPPQVMGSQVKQSIDLESAQYAARVCADGETTFGIDVSVYQGDIDWQRVANDGVKYAVIRVSAGLDYEDVNFATNWRGAGQAGVLRGVYQYYHPRADPSAQAWLLVNRLREVGGAFELPPVIDVETDHDKSPAEIVAGMRTWIEIVERELGVRPMIYTGYYFWQDHVGNSSAFSDYPLWHPQYSSTDCPNISAPWSDWMIWQYSSTGRVDGIVGDVDLNRFNGDEAALIAWSESVRRGGDSEVSLDTQYAARPRGQSFPLASEDPIELCRGESLSGEIRIENTGELTWDSSVVLAPIPRDTPSSLWDQSTWRSPTRVASATEAVPPGDVGVFRFDIRPSTLGAFSQYFGLVAEGVTWFADAGGPSDDYLQLKLSVRECEVPEEIEDQGVPLEIDQMTSASEDMEIEESNAGREAGSEMNAGIEAGAEISAGESSSSDERPMAAGDQMSSQVSDQGCQSTKMITTTPNSLLTLWIFFAGLLLRQRRSLE